MKSEIQTAIIGLVARGKNVGIKAEHELSLRDAEALIVQAGRKVVFLNADQLDIGNLDNGTTVLIHSMLFRSQTHIINFVRFVRDVANNRVDINAVVVFDDCESCITEQVRNRLVHI